jgi:hypothetical protein
MSFGRQQMGFIVNTTSHFFINPLTGIGTFVENPSSYM